MYIVMQINLIEGSFKPIGIFQDKAFGEETIKELNKDKNCFHYITDEIPVVIKKED